MTHDCRERESQRLPAIDQLIQDGVIQAQRNGKGTFIGCSPTLLASDYKQVPLVLERVKHFLNTPFYFFLTQSKKSFFGIR